MNRLTLLIALLGLCTGHHSHHHLDAEFQQKHFDGYDVFRVVPKNSAELSALRNLAENEEYQLDFWKHPTAVHQAVDVMVPPDKATSVEMFLNEHGMSKDILMKDVERYIEKERLGMASSSILTGRDSDAFFTSYRTLDEIYTFIDELGEKNPNHTSVFSVGKSSDNIDLKVIKIGSKSSKASKPAIWIDGGIHAREWVSPATVTYLASRLADDYNKDEEVKDLVDFYDWYFLPVFNPDGYNYTHSTNRMWRKSTKVTRRSSIWGCKGVDLNRNWGFHWREGGSSRNPCSETYAGPHAFSEPETKAVSDYIYKRRETFKAYLAVHSYSQLWLTPWGWTSDLPKDYDQMVLVAQESVDALSKLYNTQYKIGSSTNILYIASGGADDWAKGAAEIKYSYTLELRDTGRYGFMLPSEQILPTGIETFAGIAAMARSIKREL